MGAVIYTIELWKAAFGKTSAKLMVSDIRQHGYIIYVDGHPVCAAVALRALDVMDSEGLIAKCAERGRVFLSTLKSKLEELHVVQQVRGTGVMLGVDLVSDIATDVEQKVLLEHEVALRASSLSAAQSTVRHDRRAVCTRRRCTGEGLASWATLAESAINKSRQHSKKGSGVRLG